MASDVFKATLTSIGGGVGDRRAPGLELFKLLSLFTGRGYERKHKHAVAHAVDGWRKTG